MSQWFEMSTGSLVVGEAAYAERLEQTPPGDLVPLAELLLGAVATEGAAKAPKGTYKVRVSNDELESYGSWLLNVVREKDSEAILNTPILRNAHVLELGINPEAVMKRFGSLNELRTRIDSPSFAPFGTFKNWSTEDFVDNANKLSLILGDRKPKKSDYREWARTGNGPGPNVIQSSVAGGITQLNAYLGFPDINSFEHEDFIEWGVRAMRVNNGMPLGVIPLTVLSKRGCGPSEGPIYEHFSSVTSYAALVTERYTYEESLRDEHTAELLSRFEEFYIPQSPNPADWSEERKLQFSARYTVASYCLPGVPAEQIFNISKNSSNTFVSAIQRINPDLTAGHIEVVAETLDVFDDIWQLYPNDKRLLKINNKEIETERTKRRLNKRASMSRKKLNKEQPNSSAA